VKTDIPVIDSHTHLDDPAEIDNLRKLVEHLGFQGAGLACIPDTRDVNMNPAAMVAKKRYPGVFWMFGGLDHSPRYSGGKAQAPDMAEQVDTLIALGADGVKMLESKPGETKLLGIGMDDAYYDGAFERLEETGLPLVWHVADPEEFWDPELTPKWASERNWGYDSSHPAKETLYAQTLRVLERHPSLRVMFAHFFFLSADLPRASTILERFPGVHFDLAPGIEMLYNLSRDASGARDFFTEYADRIVYGTDVWSSMNPEQAGHRAGLGLRWLTSTDEFRVPDGADFLLGPPEDGVIRGLGLPDDAVARICGGNFRKLAGDTPRPLKADLAADECERLAGASAILSDRKAEDTPAYACAVELRAAR